MDWEFEGKRLHFVGAGGVSMSALLRLAAHYGSEVSGSDREEGALASLLDDGFFVYGGERPEVAERADLVIYTSAVPPTHSERAAAKREMERSEFLGRVAAHFPKVVAIAGTHGKTTVSGFLCSILLAADMLFCAHIGGYVPAISGNVHLGGGEIFVTEACEYQRHFLTLHPYLGVVTNVEYDHPDAYRSPEDLQEAFGKFGTQCASLVCDEGAVCSYAQKHTRIYAHPFIFPRSMNDDTLELTFMGTYVRSRPKVWGDFNRQNAALAAAAAILLGVPTDAIERGIASYEGAGRRQQLMGLWRGIPVFSDYAHHPTEIAAFTKAAKERYGHTTVVFQAHTYTRTEALLDRFADCFDCDFLVLIPTFAAREAPRPSVDEALYRAIRVRDKARCTPEQLVGLLQEKAPHQKYGAILFVGAGDVHGLSMNLLHSE